MRGFREKKPNLRRIYRAMAGKTTQGGEGLEHMQELIAESHARVAAENPKKRAQQLEEKELLGELMECV